MSALMLAIPSVDVELVTKSDSPPLPGQAQDECKELSERAAGLGREDREMEVAMEGWDYSGCPTFHRGRSRRGSL